MNVYVKAVLWVGGLLMLFVGAILSEEWLRSTQQVPIPITVIGDPAQISISATRGPDFLWIGDLWWINVSNQQPVELAVNGQTSTLPAGTHTITYNHDASNAHTYFPKHFQDPPSHIQATLQPAPTANP